MGRLRGASLLAGWAIALSAPAAPSGDEPRVALLAAMPPAGPPVPGMREVAPGVAAVRLPAAEATAFSRRHPELRLRPAALLHPHLDRALPQVGIPGVREDLGLTGTGTFVGVIDRAFDLRHPALRREDGGTRVAWLLTAGEPAGLHPELEDRFGCTDPAQAPCAIYAASDIDSLLAEDPVAEALTDADGHGTHIAAIAAGSDVPANRPYVGVAPEAELLLVAFDAEAYLDSVLTGARFIFDRADEAGRPVAVNLSSGFHGGPHDGSSLLATGLAAFVGDDQPGHGFVASAGNEGEIFSLDGLRPMGIHTDIQLAGDACAIGLETVDVEGPVEVWLSYPEDASFELSSKGPAGEPWLSWGGLERGPETVGEVTITVTEEPAAPGRGAARIRFEGTWPAARQAALQLRGVGHVDLWVHSELGASLPRMVLLDPTPTATVSIPAVHPDLIAVGATVSRIEWPSVEGTPAPRNVALGEVAAFSSAGPSPSAWLKPDLVAPGSFVVSALAEAARPTPTSSSEFSPTGECQPGFVACSVVSDTHGALAGTSMSAPIVTGAAALLFEAQPSLTQPALREALVAAARPLDEGAQGAGELDIAASAALLEGLSSGPVDLAASALRWLVPVGRPGGRYDVLLHLRDADGAPVVFEPEALAAVVTGGLLTGEPTVIGGSSVRLSAVADGSPELIVDVVYAGVPLRAVLPVAANRCAPPPPVDEGGCAMVTPTSRSTTPWALLAALLALAGGRRLSSPRDRASRAR